MTKKTPKDIIDNPDSEVMSILRIIADNTKNGNKGKGKGDKKTNGVTPPSPTVGYMTETEALDYMINKKRCYFIKDTGKGDPGYTTWHTRDVFGRPKMNFSSETAIKQIFRQPVRLDGKYKIAPIGEFYVEVGSDRRKEFDSTFFDPSKPQEWQNMLNEYKGRRIEPKKGSWELTKRHMYRILCCKNRRKYKDLKRWLAWCVQNEGCVAEVAPVFKGKKGAGKGIIPDQLVEIYGEYALPISKKGQFLGQFTGHLTTTLFVFADEAFWGGDKQSEGALKQLITQKHLTHEGKYKAAAAAINRIKMIIAANEDWVIPASEDERRFFVLYVDNYYAHREEPGPGAPKAEKTDYERFMKERDEYFTPIWDELANGGREAMLYELLNMKLGKWHPRNIHKTEELKDQVRHGILHLDQLEEHFSRYDNHVILTDEVRLLLFGKTTGIAPRDNQAMGKAMVKLGWENKQISFMGDRLSHYSTGNGEKRLATHKSEGGRIHLVEEGKVVSVLAGTHPMQELIEVLISEGLKASGFYGFDLSDFAR
jgi:hypothetical protein